MYKVISIMLLYVFVNISLDAQRLFRQADGGLAIDMSEMPNAIIDCPQQEKIEVHLFEKINKEEERTCSKKNGWEKVETLQSARHEISSFVKKGPGIYKAEVLLNYQCGSSGPARRSISQLVTTNVINDLSMLDFRFRNKVDNEFLIYPNPSLSQFILNINHDDASNISDYRLQVHAIDGRLVFEKNISFSARKNYAVDLDEFPAGQYTFSVFQGDTSIGQAHVFKISQ